LRSYTFTYLDKEGEVIGTLDAECAGDDAALARGLRAKPPVAAVVEIACGNRTIVKRRLDSE
jgi:hypothetical protein